jgi:DEAD/DEAH box helicase domain-containing protein
LDMELWPSIIDETGIKRYESNCRIENSEKMGLSAFVEYIKKTKDLGAQVVYHRYLPRQEPKFKESLILSKVMSHLLREGNIKKLYTHQIEAIERIKEGRDILVSTHTASGKSLIYNIPVIEEILINPATKALYIFPLKALEQDQLKNLYDFISGIPEGQISATIYDGDTSSWDRQKIKKKVPNIILTNPDMLHRAILAYHERWADFFSNLDFVVIDEVHTYRGIFGSHLAQILRRLKRICLLYKTTPQFILSSATIQNPHEFGKKLIDKDVEVISQSGAPKSGQHFMFLNPQSSTNFLATQFFIECLNAGLRTITFTQSRKVTELINMWVKQLAPEFKAKVSSYRAGFLPEERRSIERRLARGELLGVISTSALEMGIDIGYLDVCILVGYPGTIINTWQRGGRVGRSGRDSLVALIANQDALDQYFIQYPEKFFEQSFEAAVIDPDNAHVMRAHLPCAAAEHPLSLGDIPFWNSELESQLEVLESLGELSRTSEGNHRWFATKKRPHLGVNIRSVGETYTIFDGSTGEAIGTIDGVRAFKECHPGAIYLHRANPYYVDRLMLDRKNIIVRHTDLNYLTSVRSEKETEILKVKKSQPKGQFVVKLGELKVTETIAGYEKRRIPGQELIGVFPLDLPPQTFETVGLWVEIDHIIKRMVETKDQQFMGGIHAIEHAAISLFPLFALCDRNDIGGISYTFHPQIGKSAIFFYDGYPGGVGLAQRGFEIILQLLEQTLDLIKGCPCEEGCPSCIYSPKCGSGNKPLDKKGSIMVLEALTGLISLTDIPPAELELPPYRDQPKKSPTPEKENHKKILYFDLETQKSALEVGGWQNTHLMMVSVAVIYDSLEDRFYFFTEDQVESLISHLSMADLVIGFNLKRFDYPVLAPYTCQDLTELPTFDLLEEIYDRLGYRLSLDHLARETLDREKHADGLQALEWYKAGEIEKLMEYCKQDVILTRDLFLHGLEKGQLIYRNKKENQRLRLLVDWNIDNLIHKANKRM